MTWFAFWLILHILGAFVAFGPSFAFGLIVAASRKEPQHARFALHVIETISKRMTIPIAVLVPLFGVALIYTAPGHIDLWKSEWLIISIVLYMGAFFFGLFVQLPREAKMLAAMDALPPGPPPEGAGGPPPHIAAMGKRLQFGGMYMSLSVVVILVLMVWRPGNCQGIC
ncbi:MAG TPA: DUF2269 family protein [Actinomycetota bacterium]|nr:DUF2269 family protein [Actinomycetota bacterium]